MAFLESIMVITTTVLRAPYGYLITIALSAPDGRGHSEITPSGACIMSRRIELQRIGGDDYRDGTVSGPGPLCDGPITLHGATFRLVGIPVDLFASHGTRKAGAWKGLILHAVI